MGLSVGRTLLRVGVDWFCLAKEIRFVLSRRSIGRSVGEKDGLGLSVGLKCGFE